MSKERKELDSSSLLGIYNKILEIYPFLTKKERLSFLNKSKDVLKKLDKNQKSILVSIQKILVILNNPHAYAYFNKKKTKKIKPYFKYKIKKRILYIKISRWSAPDRKEALRRGEELISVCRDNMEEYDGIILDVRGNSGGYSAGAQQLASIFFKKSFFVKKIIKRDGNKLIMNNVKQDYNPFLYIKVPIVMLIDKKCFSSNELFIAPFKISKRAIIIGEATRGGSANPVMLDYKIGRNILTVKIPTYRLFLKGESRPIEETKIKPDIYYKKKDIIRYAEKILQTKIRQ